MTEPTWTLPSDAAIKTILGERIDKQRDGVGIVVGVIDPDGQRVVAHGRYRRGGRREVDGRTLFEIGSITKVFTSLLLSDMALRDEVALDDPVAAYLPEGVVVPERGGRRITLGQLATHTSGLPRSQTNLAPKDWSNRYADCTVEQLYTFLSGHVLSRDIGAQYEYSNVGVGLLGHVLARRLATDYESLVKERIADPLGLDDTSIQLSPDQRKRLAHGHDAGRRPVPDFGMGAIPGAGALRSTTDDLLAFLAVALGYEDAPLKGAIDAQLTYPMRARGQGFSVGLGWHAIENERGRAVWHTGGSRGYETFMGLNPARGWGAVVLTNTRTHRRGGRDIGMHILTGAPLGPAPRRRRKPSPGTEDVLRRYVVSGANGQRSYDDMAPALAEAERARWPSREAIIKARGVPKSITFLRVDPEGRDVYDVVYQNGRVEWSITPLGPDGKVAGIRRRTAP
jgi:serine-type D-Ala-D-Ala carboxypeptidase/endopeptidase